MAIASPILRRRDYALVALSRWLAPLLRGFGEIEFDLIESRLRDVVVRAPVFVTGLARSGTTTVLTLLSRADGVATHRYRDFPFLATPVLWNVLQDWLGGDVGTATERPHRDRIRITRESPEAFEEPIWQAFFPESHDPARCHVLGPDIHNPAFEKFFVAHLRKILWLRGGVRYLSKGNYNVARIGYLARLFPDARFVIPVRSPATQVSSLVRQHALFCRYAAEDRRVGRYLASAGHYEFGPQRRPINLDPERAGEIESAWHEGDELRGYARQWAAVYAHVDRLRREYPELERRILVLRYEDLCARPDFEIRRLLEFCGLADSEGRVAAAAGEVAAPAESGHESEVVNRVWNEVAPVAKRFGYRASER
ncbi:MAG: sulfotransferase [Burkholderiales bacterium]